MKGELVGINSQILSSNDGNIGIGFAIPANMAKNVMEQLRTKGKVTRAQLGVHVQGITPEMAESLGLKQSTGAIVASVEPGGTAVSGTWTRAAQINQYTLTATDGTPILLNPGRTWVELPNHPWGALDSNTAAGLLAGAK